MTKKITKLAFCIVTLFTSSLSLAEVPPPNPVDSKITDEKVAASAAAVDTKDFVEQVTEREPTKEELIKIKKLWEGMRSVQEKSVAEQPRPTISMMNLDLSPGSTPPLVRISNQTGVLMMFMDANGKRWPVEHVDSLSDNEIEVQNKPYEKGHNQYSVFAKAKRSGAIGNVAIFLRDFDTPIIVTLLAGQKEVDYRVDFRVPSSLDGSAIGLQYKSEFDDRLSAAVMGITPSGCTPQSSDDKSLMAWQCQSDSIIRSRGILLSPATLDGKKVSGSDGTNAYLIPTTPVVSMAYDGEIKSVKLGQ